MQALVFIHGLFGHLNIPEVHGHLSGYRVLTPDLLGYGRQRHAELDGLTLHQQAGLVIDTVEQQCESPVHLAGHSVGGAVAILVASLRPDLVASLVSIEGNFTLDDAFWSQQIAATADCEVEHIVKRYADDPDQWMRAAVANTTPLTSRLAREWLEHQPASTIKAQAKAVVDATGNPQYLALCRAVMDSAMPVALLAGARSAMSWHTPAWANELCSCRINVPATGHLLMAESPDRFAAAIQCLLQVNEAFVQ